MNCILEELARGHLVTLKKVAVRFNQTRDGAGILIGELRIDRLYGVGGIYEVSTGEIQFFSPMAPDRPERPRRQALGSGSA